MVPTRRRRSLNRITRRPHLDPGDSVTKLRREIRIPVYWVMVGLVVMVVSPILSIVVSVKINQRTIQVNERARAEARAESSVRYCRLVGSQVDVYADAVTPVGKTAYRTWLTEYKLARCQPVRE
jgi:hypothetical protein